MKSSNNKIQTKTNEITALFVASPNPSATIIPPTRFHFLAPRRSRCSGRRPPPPPDSPPSTSIFNDFKLSIQQTVDNDFNLRFFEALRDKQQQDWWDEDEIAALKSPTKSEKGFENSW
ncbi:hypothetical protein Droror1_Dr00021392 [Drosera rotundifolia]